MIYIKKYNLLLQIKILSLYLVISSSLTDIYKLRITDDNIMR